MHEPGLLRAEQVARAAQFEILECDPISGAEFRVVFEHRKPALRVIVDPVGHEQVAVRAAVRAPHAPAQLVELREAEMVGAVHEHRVRVGHVEPALDDERGHEDVDAPLDELRITDSSSRSFICP